MTKIHIKDVQRALSLAEKRIEELTAGQKNEPNPCPTCLPCANCVDTNPFSTLLTEAAALLRPLSGLLNEHSSCYLEGKCPDCSTLKANTRAFLSRYDEVINTVINEREMTKTALSSALDLLEQHQWKWSFSHHLYFCISCEGLQSRGCEPNCTLAQLLMENGRKVKYTE